MEQGKPVPLVSLFFGCRHETGDFIFKEQIKNWVEKGVINKLYTAFSRDTVPVSHNIGTQSLRPGPSARKPRGSATIASLVTLQALRLRLPAHGEQHQPNNTNHNRRNRKARQRKRQKPAAGARALGTNHQRALVMIIDCFAHRCPVSSGELSGYSVKEVEVVLVFGILMLTPPDVLGFVLLLLHRRGCLFSLLLMLRLSLVLHSNRSLFLLYHVSLDLELLRIDYGFHVV